MVSRTIFLSALVLFSVIASAVGLKDSAWVDYNTYNTVRCPGTCCGRCGLRYTLRGRWESQSEGKPTRLGCFQKCSKHYSDCTSKCKCLTSSKSIRDTNGCKCTPSYLPGILRRCENACIKGLISCFSGCLTGKGCITAQTNVNFYYNACGRCGRSRCCYQSCSAYANVLKVQSCRIAPACAIEALPKKIPMPKV